MPRKVNRAEQRRLKEEAKAAAGGAGAEGDADDAEEGADASPSVTKPAAAAAAATADDDTATVTSAAAASSVTVASGGAGGGSGAITSTDEEEMGGEAAHKQQMASAVESVTMTFASSKIHPNARTIQVENLSIVLKGRELLKETSLALNWDRRYGLVGPNGCGKSLLLELIGKRMVPLPDNLDVYHLSGEVDPSDLTALEAVMAVDKERADLEAAAADLEGLVTGEDNPEQEALNERLCEIYERLEEMGAEQAEARASKLLFGLGFDQKSQAKKCKEFSGGWRMRIALARALFLGPSCLLLDEPTNHLDMEAVVWLENYLARWNKILLLISHSEDFLNNVCTNIITMQQKKLVVWGGNYESYLQTRREKEDAQSKRYEKEQEQIAHIKDFVSRFGHGTRKMAQQAQSREKVLAKLEAGGLTERVEVERGIRMRFPSPEKLPPPVLMLANVSFGYPGCPTLYDKVDFGVDLDSRIALVGPNGAGKTTLLKLIAGELIPTSGAVRPHPHLRMARYTQHFVDSLELDLTPLEYFCKLQPDVPMADQRSRLGRFGITGEYQSMVMRDLSDGLKSRVVFALMATRSPHILLLDEPTNHLDIETIDSLAAAIKVFEGGVVLVSHDMRLIGQVAEQIYECDHKAVTLLRGDIQQYKTLLQERIARAEEKFDRDRRAAAATGK